MITTLEDFKVYQLAMELGEKVWNIVIKWDWFAKDTIGKQWVRAVDSIASNLSEGLGRYHYREKKHYGYYSRGSLFECKTWLTKSLNRKLISEKDYKQFIKELDICGVKINNYINSIGNDPKSSDDN